MELYFNYTNRTLKQPYVFKENVLIIKVIVNCYTFCDVWHFLKLLQQYVALK